MPLASNAIRAAELAVALVNLATPGYSRGQPYASPPAAQLIEQFTAALSRHWAAQLDATDQAGERLSRLAAGFHDVFTADRVERAVDALNLLLSRYRSRPYLASDHGQPFHLHFHGDADTPVESLGGEFAVALAMVLDMYGEARFGICQAHHCDRVYVDLTRNGRRRYCSEGCTARAKMAAYRQRQTTK